MAIMKILSTLVRFSGWTPVGKSVLIKIDDAAETKLNNQKFVGKVAALSDNGTALIELDSPINIAGESRDFVNAIPRHTGYDFYHLCFGFIAVNLVNLQGNMVNNGQMRACFAIASMKICH